MLIILLLLWSVYLDYTAIGTKTTINIVYSYIHICTYILAKEKMYTYYDMAMFVLFLFFWRIFFLFVNLSDKFVKTWYKIVDIMYNAVTFLHIYVYSLGRVCVSTINGSVHYSNYGARLPNVSLRRKRHAIMMHVLCGLRLMWILSNALSSFRHTARARM